ncbi:MAG: DUF2019 domain-containing protein [Xanthobacteraceae bacterium]
MTGADLKAMTVAQLVDDFAEMGVKQNEALLWDELSEFNSLYWQIDPIREELKSRPGDQRRALLALFNHPDMQVRLNAAKSTLAIAPDQARAMLERIKERRRGPQAGDAGMCLWNLDGGVFVPK